MNSPDHDEQLERLIHRTLRDLPPRRAPRSLEQRVMAELQRRAALPWWRKSFAHWPLAARTAFLVLSGAGAACIVLALWVATGISLQPLQDAIRLQFAWLESVRAVLGAIGSFFDILQRNIPPLWLYAIAGFVASMYVALFGLGAAAYRALRPQHSSRPYLSAS